MNAHIQVTIQACPKKINLRVDVCLTGVSYNGWVYLMEAGGDLDINPERTSKTAKNFGPVIAVFLACDFNA